MSNHSKKEVEIKAVSDYIPAGFVKHHDDDGDFETFCETLAQQAENSKRGGSGINLNTRAGKIAGVRHELKETEGEIWAGNDNGQLRELASALKNQLKLLQLQINAQAGSGIDFDKWLQQLPRKQAASSPSSRRQPPGGSSRSVSSNRTRNPKRT